jgi:hypothetical protein
MTKSPTYIADFDSATAMVRANASVLRGEDFPALGLGRRMKPVGKVTSLMPWALRRKAYIFGGWAESQAPSKVDQIEVERIAEWIAQEYPDRQYPAVAIGSSNGALTHLYAAAGIPFLPQTVLLPVRQSVHPDEPTDAMEMGVEPGRVLLENNPEVQLHHMHDANQDRLMVRTMTYFRVKRRELGPAYERFLQERLAPGGTILLVDCRVDWGVTRVSDRHVFQHGALGGATEQEFHEGSERVEEYLRRYGSHRTRWEGPEPTERAPEAEWGFAKALADDVERFARENGYRIERITFDNPEDASPFVADLHRWWYRRRRIPASRLVVSSFVVMEPHWSMRTGSVPYWMKFNTEPSADAIEAYLDGLDDPYDEIHMMLFSHGVNAVGVVPIERWRKVLDRARRHGAFLGVDEEAYPGDFATFANYHSAIQRIPARYPLPGPLLLDDVQRFLDDSTQDYEISWERPATPLAA